MQAHFSCYSIFFHNFAFDWLLHFYNPKCLTNYQTLTKEKLAILLFVSDYRLIFSGLFFCSFVFSWVGSE